MHHNLIKELENIKKFTVLTSSNSLVYAGTFIHMEKPYKDFPANSYVQTYSWGCAMHQDLNDVVIPVGIRCTEFYRVGDAHVANHVGALSTPSMILFMELTAMRCVEKYIPIGYTTVGFSVNVRHVSPAPPNAVVRVEAELVSREGRKLVFSVRTFLGERVVGEGVHERYIVSVERFLDKVRRSWP